MYIKYLFLACVTNPTYNHAFQKLATLAAQVPSGCPLFRVGSLYSALETKGLGSRV